MFIQKKHLAIIALCLRISTAESAYHSQECPIQEATPENQYTLARCAEHAGRTVAQAVDSLICPVLCIIAGRAAYNTYLKGLVDTPRTVYRVERHLPGGDTARYYVTYLALGTALFAALGKLTTMKPIRTFMDAHMPHTKTLLTVLEDPFLIKHRPGVTNYPASTHIICRDTITQ